MPDWVGGRLGPIWQPCWWGPGDSLGGQQHVFPGVQLGGVCVLPVQVLAHGFGRELCLADVAEVPGQVDGFTCRGGTAAGVKMGGG